MVELTRVSTGQSFVCGIDFVLRRDSTERELLRQVGTPSLGSNRDRLAETTVTAASPRFCYTDVDAFPRFACDAVVLLHLTSFISAFPARRLVSAKSKLKCERRCGS
jgi:hypothetical protein